jgi:hypothetical protein
MTPAAVELALEIRREIEARHEEADRLRNRALERAQIATDLAQRRFMMVDPGNRLVADTLEREWNEKLRALAKAQEEREQGRQQDKILLDGTIRKRLVAMTTDFKTVWADPHTPNRQEYGLRRHSRTQRLPLECFEAEEQPHLVAPPTQLYEIPHWCDPKVGRDHLAQVAKALYSLPTRFIGKHLRARADRTLVCFYDQGKLVKTHARQSPGGRSIDPSDFPPHKSAYAMRDIGFLEHQATQHGEVVGRFAHQVLEGPLPWTRMRRGYALLALVRRYGEPGRADVPPRPGCPDV